MNWTEVARFRLYVDLYANGIYLWHGKGPINAYWVGTGLSRPCVIGDAGSFGALMAMNLAAAHHPLLSKE